MFSNITIILPLPVKLYPKFEVKCVIHGKNTIRYYARGLNKSGDVITTYVRCKTKKKGKLK